MRKIVLLLLLVPFLIAAMPSGMTDREYGKFVEDSAGDTAIRVKVTGGSTAPEGTAVLSTGETSGNKYLREDGDGTSSWQVVAGGAHDAVTLDADAAVLFDLATQEIGLDVQTANYIFGGPATGAANEPTFRALVDADIPDTITITEADPTVNTSAEIVAIIGAGVYDASGAAAAVTPTTLSLLIGTNTQAWDTQLDDLADGTLTGDFVNTAFPWADNEVSDTLTSSACTGNAATVTNATLTTALTVNTGTVGLTGNVANTSVLTLGAGASSISGANTGDNSANSTYTIGSATQAYDADLTTWAGITPGANVGTFLGTPSSANLLAAITDETGTGTAVFNNSPTFADDIQLGLAGATGILKLYSEQGATDYTASLYPNTAMTSAASFYLPVDEPAAQSFLSMSTGGVMSFVAPNAGTNIANDLEEEVTEGSLADSVIVSADIKDGEIAGGDINAVLDLGGKTSVEIPNGANPTTDAAGEIAVDSSAAPGSGIRFYGDAAYTIAGTYSKSFVILNPVATDDYPIWCSPYAITIKKVRVQCLGGTNIVGQLTECDAEGINPAVVDSADITATANNSVDDDGTLSNSSIDALDYVGWATTSISGTPTSVTVSFDFIVNQVN